jgi:hypothetical protein
MRARTAHLLPPPAEPRYVQDERQARGSTAAGQSGQHLEGCFRGGGVPPPPQQQRPAGCQTPQRPRHPAAARQPLRKQPPLRLRAANRGSLRFKLGVWLVSCHCMVHQPFGKQPQLRPRQTAAAELPAAMRSWQHGFAARQAGAAHCKCKSAAPHKAGLGSHSVTSSSAVHTVRFAFRFKL